MNFRPLFAFFALFAIVSAFSHGEAASRAAAEEVHVNFIVGEIGRLTCRSSYPPPWTKSSQGDMKIIGVNGKKYSNWDEPRFAFSSEDRNYSIRISQVRLVDAGKYACGSDTPVTFILTVLR